MRLTFLLLLCLPFLSAKAQTSTATGGVIKAVNSKSEWAEKQFKELSPEERISQLFMIAAYSNKDAAYERELIDFVKKNQVGGLIFMQGSPTRQASLHNRLQAVSKVPLLVSMDAEWGMKMRLDSVPRFPYALLLGAVQDDLLIEEMTEVMASNFHRMGVNISFAPVIDVNSNPKNPIIGFRSFGEDRDNVAEKGTAFMRGLQRNHILACAKHFPGHGDTDTDSHLALPVIKHNRTRLDEVELYPFRKLIGAGVGSIMITHLYVPALDARKDLPSTLSKPIVTGLLKDELGFEGIVITDAMNMKGVTGGQKSNGAIEVNALLAGNDILLFPEDVPAAIDAVKAAVRDGIIFQSLIDAKCRKVLALKDWCELDTNGPINPENLIADLNNKRVTDINQRITDNAITVLSNRSVMPLREGAKLASVAIGASGITDFQKLLKTQFPGIALYSIDDVSSMEELEAIQVKLNDADVVLNHIEGMNVRARYGVSTGMIQFVDILAKDNKNIFLLFGNPYALTYFENLKDAEGLVVGYQDMAEMLNSAIKLLKGEIKSEGKLPVSAGKTYPVGSGK